MKGNLKKMEFWICNFILMDYWIEIVVFYYLERLGYLMDIML